MKVAIYTRVSTEGQNLLNQRKALVEKSKREGWDFDIFEEKESTRKTRPVKYDLYNRLLKGNEIGLNPMYY